MTPLTPRAFPHAILHIDADAFFAACEQARDPRLKGKPVVTGKERGIASAVSYEAKALGIKRGMTIQDIRRICPHIVYLPADYETYSLYSARMFSIVRDYTALVEEYSIDECFAELTGLQRPRRMSYEAIATALKHDLDTKLGITFSVGLAPTKVVAKIASKWNKPSGLTIISGKQLPNYLRQLPVGDVWGIGPQTSAYLAQFNIHTALDFASQEESWINQYLTKPHQATWHELCGNAVLPLKTEPKHTYQSISKTKTFIPSSSNRAFVFGQLSKNIENACIKARRYHLIAKKVSFFLRTHNFHTIGTELTLARASAFPHEIVRVVEAQFDQVFTPHTHYRLTGVVLSHLEENKPLQLSLFEDPLKVEQMIKLYDSIDQLDQQYGKHTVFLGPSLPAVRPTHSAGPRSELPNRKIQLFRGETARKRLGLPMLSDVN